MAYFLVMQGNEKVITPLNLVGDFLLLLVSVSYGLILGADLSVLGPEWLLEDSSLTRSSAV